MLKLKELENMLFQGKINRREFIARVSAIELTAAMSPALLASAAHASSPKKGGRLRIGCAGTQTSDSLDPITVSNLMIESLTWQLSNCLVEVDYKSNPIPELAEDWMFSTTYAAGASWNESGWKHERFNKLLKEARSELDEKKRREKYVEMQKIVRDEGGFVIHLFPSDIEHNYRG